MRFKLNDLREILIKYDFYILEIDEKFENIDEASVFMRRLNDMLRYMFKNKNISFIMGVSEVDGKSAIKYSIKNHTRGRPKTVIRGKKKEPHIHALLYGEKVCTNALDATRRINKNAKRTIAKAYKARDNGFVSGYVPYLIEQSKSIRTFGNFDFMQLKGGYYREVLA